MKFFQNIKSVFESHKEYFVYIIGGLLGLLIAFKITYQIITDFNNKQVNIYSPLYVQNCVYTLKYNSAKNELFNEVDSYIKNIAPQSSLDGYVVMEECLENSIDICFVLAQGEQESHFGTTGLARKTNSVFNVYAFDGLSHNEISSQGKYKHPNYSVKPYIELLKSDYLVNGKTEYDLMDGEYVNKNGARYASSETYEKSLLNKYTKIRQNTKIDSLCQEVNKYKLFLGL